MTKWSRLAEEKSPVRFSNGKNKMAAKFMLKTGFKPVLAFENRTQIVSAE